MAFYLRSYYIFERMKRRLLLFSLNFFFVLVLSAQVDFSLASGASVLRNFSPQQGFWAFGQTIRAAVYFSPKQSAYASLDYYTEGKYKNSFTASAKSPATSPQELNYTATGRLTYRQVSLGWKHFFKGSYHEQRDYTIYGTAGFGFLFSKVRNTVPVDTVLYNAIPTEGESKVRKLTFDLGLGVEQCLGGNFFAFGEGRLWLPASSHTNPYLSNQKNVPLAGMFSIGLRVLFGTLY